MQALFEQLLILFSFILIGFALTRAGVLDQALAHGLSLLEFYVFCPCLNFLTFAKSLNFDSLCQNANLIFWGLGVFVFTDAVSRITGKLLAKNDYERAVYEYSLLIPNYGFVGNALIDALYGSQTLLRLMLFTLAQTVFTYTKGYASLSGDKRSLSAALLNPGIIAVALGAVVGLCGAALPEGVERILTIGKGCMAPVAMLMTGIVIGGFRFKDILSDWRGYFVSAMRLIIMPVATVFLINHLPLKPPEAVVICASILLLLPTGIGPIIYAQMSGRDCHTGAGLLLITSVLSMASIPLLLGWLLKM